MNTPEKTVIKEDYRKEAFDMLESALQWYQRMETEASEDIYDSHYGSYFVTAYDFIRKDIKEMIEDYSKVRYRLGNVIYYTQNAMQTLEADLLGGFRQAKAYWQYMVNIEINLKSARFYFKFDELYNPVHKDEGNLA